MKKILILAIFLNTVLFSTVKVPMDPRVMTTDNGGLKDAAAAYQDGIGIIVAGDLEQVDNKSYNDLVIKYGDEAEKSGQPLKQYLEEKSDLPAEDQSKLNKINNLEPLVGLNGVSCNDGDSGTVQDVYDENNVCLGLTPINYCISIGFENTDGSNCFNWSYSNKILDNSNFASQIVNQKSVFYDNFGNIAGSANGYGEIQNGIKCRSWTLNNESLSYTYYPRGAVSNNKTCKAYGTDSAYCPSGMVYKDSLCRKTTSPTDNVCPNAYYLSGGICYAKDYSYCQNGFEDYGNSLNCRQKTNIMVIPQ